MDGEMSALRERAERAAILRLTTILEDDETSASDAIKAASLVLDKLRAEENEVSDEVFQVVTSE